MYNETLLPMLNKEGVYLLAPNEWSDEQTTYLQSYFMKIIFRC